MITVPMNITNMSAIWAEDDLLRFVGEIAGECYNSSKDVDRCITRALSCIKRGHHSPWEHVSITMKCTVDRGTSHALVRHRHCAFQQSSTIYQRFNELVVIANDVLDPETIACYETQEREYLRLIAKGNAPAEARDVLPTDLATNLIITTSFREWMFMVQRRCGPGDSKKMHQWDALLRNWFQTNYPKILAAFDAWYEKHPL